MNCIETLDRLGEALEGTLPEVARAGFQEHLAACAACRNYVDQLQVTLRAIERLPSREGPNPRREALLEAFRRKFR